ncbi:MAG: Glycosyl transferase, WecB/TagA/CpsF family, partial [uncultured bacterium]
MKTINILGTKISAVTKKEALAAVKQFLGDNRQHLITTPNPEFLVTAYQNEKFKNLLNRADLNLPDGVGLKWAAYLCLAPLPNNFLLRFYLLLWRFLWGEAALVFYQSFFKKYLPEQISGTDIIENICQLAVENNLSIFLLGAQSGTGKRCAEKLKAKYLGLKIAGTHEGSPQENEDQKTVEIIKRTSADILLVAYGAPKQEFWLKRNLAKIPTVKIGMGVGGAFDYLSGDV